MLYRTLGVSFALASLTAFCSPSGSFGTRDILDAVRSVETGGLPNQGIGAKGDGGKAIGPYQIHKVYFLDAAEFDRTIQRPYLDCLRDKEFSEQVVGSYMRRYAKEEWARLTHGKGTEADAERVARIHNGGPKGDRKKATQPYWRKVKANLCSKKEVQS